jgi:hypothetical protein
LVGAGELVAVAVADGDAPEDGAGCCDGEPPAAGAVAAG